MDTPIADFARAYAAGGTARLHMPGHKGQPLLGCEALDLTEIVGADELYAPEGIIARSERNAAALFGAGESLLVTEGSSQSIRAMLHLAALHAPGRPVLAARNAHRAFLAGAALAGVDVVWLWPEEEGRQTLCRCPVSPEGLARALDALGGPAAAVYVTSPDYLGGQLDLAALAAVAHAHGAPLLVDNAHGAYLRFLPQDAHPLAQGADLCCDSAHKTLPVLTGGGWLHIGAHAPQDMREGARRALALHGSSSPSYLILQSLDLCHRYLAVEYRDALARFLGQLGALRQTLEGRGWVLAPSDPLRLTLDTVACGLEGPAVAQRLREGGVECEYADPDFVVLMATPQNTQAELARVASALGAPGGHAPLRRTPPPFARPQAVLSPRRALLAPSESVPLAQAVGRVMADPACACPPAVPVLVSGERIAPDSAAALAYYGTARVRVVRGV